DECKTITVDEWYGYHYTVATYFLNNHFLTVIVIGEWRKSRKKIEVRVT
ncbi:9990_t:CDS:2, partial [Racocetra persica]